MADNEKFSKVKILFEDYLKGFSANTSQTNEELFEAGLRHFMDELLNECSRSANSANPVSRDTYGHSENLDYFGAVYEYLRGFKATNVGGRPVLEKCVRHRRNTGMFYTPQKIVSYIVSNAFAAANPESLYDLKILDPAVGTGRFLVEALKLMTERPIRAGIASQRFTEIKARFREKGFDIGDEAAIRIYVIENCLYGVDLDPIAIRLAKAAINPLPGSEASAEIRWNLRVGNSLIGRARATQLNIFEDDQGCFSGLFNWEEEFPEIRRGRNGFDVIVGNPPYEILSEKESGLTDRKPAQAYFRKNYSTCRGKINTYRLMLERALDLTADTGVIGFVVPVTLLADSSAQKIREKILKETRLLKTVIIPEQTRAFPGVTQGLVIIIAQKGGRTDGIRPVVWSNLNENPPEDSVSPAIKLTDFRIPIINAEEDKRLLCVTDKFPRFGGHDRILPAAQIHQGEINLTTHRDFVSTRPTSIPLVRGEHIQVFCLNHPTNRDRFDWVLPDLFDARHKNGTSLGSKSNHRNKERIVLGRVVNMHTERRLKAVLIKPGTCAGDMTNYMIDLSESKYYLMGILNSRLLNHRFKLTSTNNYISATELVALPLPRLAEVDKIPSVATIERGYEDIESAMEALKRIYQDKGALKRIIESAALELSQSPELPVNEREGIMNLMDAAVLQLYDAGPFVSMFKKA